MLDPFSERYDGVFYYRLYLGRYIAYVKVDQRAVPSDLADFVLMPNSQLVVLAREFHDSNEKSVMKKMLIERKDRSCRPGFAKFWASASPLLKQELFQR